MNKVLPTVPTEATDSFPQGVTEWLSRVTRLEIDDGSGSLIGHPALTVMGLRHRPLP